jgi:hypothetical protein
MATFVLLTVTSLAVFLILGVRWRWWSLLFLVLVAAVSCAVYVLVIAPNGGVVIKSSSPPVWGRSPWRDIFLFLAMVLGMAAKYLWDLIELRRVKNLARREGAPKAGLEFDFYDFVQPMLVAALVFAAVLAAVKDFSVSSYLFSFQNGFFWQAVLKQRSWVGRKSPGAGAGVASGA